MDADTAWEWLTTMPNPRIPGHGPDAGQRGWRLHLVRMTYGKTLTEQRYVRAACGLRPAHGWGLDLFIVDPCERCVRAVARTGVPLPEIP